jgi:hypothetical protein
MTFATEPNTPTGDRFVASSVGIMVGAADPMMMFPEGTKFAPYAAMRNVSAKEVLVAPSAHYMNGNTPVTVRLRPFRMRANEAAQLDLPAELAAAGVPSNVGMLTLGFSSTAAATDLLLATGSVDQTGTYVFEVECKGSGPSEGKILGNWNVADGNDTMVSVWNSSDADQDLTAILFYSGGQYKYPLHLAKNASTMFNVSEIIMMQMPDADGNVIPAGIQHGSAVLSNGAGQSEPANVGVSVGTFNVQTATCGTKCPTCLGYSDFWVSNAPFGVGIGSNYVVEALAQMQNGSQVSKRTSASWSSSNSAVGNSSGSGNFQGVSVGSFLANANISLISVEQDCPYNGAPCGTDPYSGSGQGAVPPTISGPTSVWWFNSFNPDSNLPTQITLTSSGGSGTTWTVTAGGAKISLTPSGSTAAVSGTGVDSDDSNDVTITATANGQSSDAFHIKARVPSALLLSGGAPVPQNCFNETGNPNLFGWWFDYNYVLRDNFNETVPGSPGVNENYNGSTVWPRVPTTGGVSGSFTDSLFVCAAQGQLAPAPDPTLPQNPLGDNLVDSPTQQWCAGSSFANVWGFGSCNGVQVQNAHVNRFVDHVTVQ